MDRIEWLRIVGIFDNPDNELPNIHGHTGQREKELMFFRFGVGEREVGSHGVR